jgi:hypothetical protein
MREQMAGKCPPYAAIGALTGVYMFDGGGNHRYGPKAPGFFGSRIFSCGGASATSWSCPTVSEDWKK